MATGNTTKTYEVAGIVPLKRRKNVKQMTKKKGPVASGPKKGVKKSVPGKKGSK